MCAHSLPTNTTGAEIFKSLNDYISGKLNWSFCVGICTDLAASMTRRLSGLTTRIKDLAPVCESTHCVIHREMLASRKLSPEIHTSVLNDVKIINHIKANTLNSRLFEQLCEKKMEAEHKLILLHTEVRWLLRGDPWQEFVLREPILIIFSEKVNTGSTLQ